MTKDTTPSADKRGVLKESQKQLFEACMLLAYEAGRMRGLVDAEYERESEEWADAFGGAVFARKFAMPKIPSVRQARSQKWKEGMTANSLNHLARAKELFGILSIPS